MSEVVMGLDTASNRLHWVCSRPVMGALYGAVHSGHSNPDVRRMNLYDCAYSLFASIRGDPVHVFCEEPLALQNGKTTRLLGLAAGAIWAAHLPCDLYWHWVDVSSWKKDVLGRGAPPIGLKVKEWVREQVRANPAFQNRMRVGDYDEKFFEEEPDLYDAWAIKTYGVRLLKQVTGASPSGQ